MLILTRRAGQAITIGVDVVVSVLMLDRGQVRVGISAPKSTVILRSELSTGTTTLMGSRRLRRPHESELTIEAGTRDDAVAN